MKPQTVHEAADLLIDPKRILLFRDEKGYNIRGDVPSLIEQLEAATCKGGGEGGGRFGDRPPVAMGVVSLLMEMSTRCAEAVQDRHGKHFHNIPDNLRRIAADRAALPAGADDVVEWIDLILGWVDRARGVLGLEPKYPRGLRGVACPLCGADSVPGVDDSGLKVRLPALQFQWSRIDDVPDDEMIPDRSVQAVECQMCGSKWAAGPQFYMLKALMDDMKRKNLACETLGVS